MAKLRAFKIILVRHGLAGKADASRFPDDDLRPLTGKGKQAFAKAARGLRALDILPVRIHASPALRTWQTAEILAQALGLKRGAIKSIPELHHHSPPASALAKLARLARPDRSKAASALVLVGHEPWLGEFLSLLVAGGPGAHFHLAKGGACQVHAEAVEPGGGRLEWCLTQDQLRALSRD